MRMQKAVLLLPILFFLLWGEGSTKQQRSSEPPTPLQDQIIQNKGNVATTVQNLGQIGGQSHLGKPSGEWPKGSQHHYLAEIKYWMGAVKPGGDTVVAIPATISCPCLPQ